MPQQRLNAKRRGPRREATHPYYVTEAEAILRYSGSALEETADAWSSRDVPVDLGKGAEAEESGESEDAAAPAFGHEVAGDALNWHPWPPEVKSNGPLAPGCWSVRSWASEATALADTCRTGGSACSGLAPSVATEDEYDTEAAAASIDFTSSEPDTAADSDDAFLDADAAGGGGEAIVGSSTPAV